MTASSAVPAARVVPVTRHESHHITFIPLRFSLGVGVPPGTWGMVADSGAIAGGSVLGCDKAGDEVISIGKNDRGDHMVNGIGYYRRRAIGHRQLDVLGSLARMNAASGPQHCNTHRVLEYHSE